MVVKDVSIEKKPGRKRLRKLYDLHAWVGFHLAIIMFVILATGTLATLSNEIDWMIFPELRASLPEDDNSVTADDWAAMYKAIRLTYPTDPIRFVFAMPGDYLTHRVIIQNSDLHAHYVHVDQYTHQVTGTVPKLTVQRFFRDFHRYLFMPAFPGILFVCSFAFILAISLYSGLKTTRNWKTAIVRLRTRQGIRIALSDFHKLAGLWGCWFTLVIVITGVWYLLEFGASAIDASFTPPQPKLVAHTDYDFQQPIPYEMFKKMAQQAQREHGDWTIKSVLFPASENGLVQFRGVKNNPLLRERAYRVYFDPVTGEHVTNWSPETLPLSAYINEYADPLHFGYFGGLTTKLIWFVFGVILTAMSVTGVLMTWKRTKTSALTKQQVATLPALVFAAIAFFFWIQRYS